MKEKNSSNSSKTDWNRVGNLTDDQIDTSDSPPLEEEFFTKAKLRMPGPSVSVTMRLDPEIFAWFKTQGEDWEQRVNAALRLYAQAHRAYEPARKTAG